MTAALGLRACHACGADLPDRAKFCLECGSPVTAGETQEHRKTVTLLFTDVTGSTALGEQLDPEALRGVMGRYFEVARRTVENHGGTIEKFVGDAVLAVFGMPEVREDDALRAVRAADELVTGVRLLSEQLTAELGIGLQIRTGVNTGAVITGSARAGGSFATGDAVNTAARLEQAAPPGQVLIGETTYALVKDAVEVEPAPPVNAKGKAEPVPAYRLLTVDASAPGRRRRLDAPLVGRARERRVLDDALAGTVAAGRSHLVTLLGGPGIGKSRLAADFLHRIGDSARVLRGRCVSYGEGTTYWPAVQIVRAAVDLDGSESAEVTSHALRVMLPGDGPDAEAVSVLLPLLGKGGEPCAADQTRWAVSRLVEQLVLLGPVVIEVDDLHWADSALLELLAHVSEECSDLPLLLLCSARPELLDAHPEWGRGALNATSVSLEPFGADDVAASLRAVIDGRVHASVATAVEAWSGGNPLFVEEIATHLLETGRLEQRDDGWRLVGDPAEIVVPPSVSALLSARLERLPDDERDCLSRISVIGLEVTAVQAEVLLTVSSGDRTAATAARTLAALARRDLLRRVRSTDGDTWVFRHLLIREAAYGVLPKRLRAELHERLADHLTVHLDAGGAATLAFAAHHLAQAATCTADLARTSTQTTQLADRAVRAAIEAADDARLRDDPSGALSLLRAVLHLEPSALVRRDHLRHLLFLLLRQHQAGDAGPHLDALHGLVADDDTVSGEMDRALVDLVGLQSRIARAEDVDPRVLIEPARRLLALAEEAGDRRCQVAALLALTDVANMAGRSADVHQHQVEIERVGDLVDQRAADQWTSAIYFMGPYPLSLVVESAAQTRARAKARAQSLRAETYEMTARAARGEPGSTDALSTLVDALGDEDAFRGDAFMLTWRADTLWLLGRTRAAVELLIEAVAAFVDGGELAFASTYLALQALYAIEAGDAPASVLPLVEQAEEWTSPYDVLSCALVATARALVAAESGDRELAERQARTALELIDDGDSWWYQAHVRRWLTQLHTLADEHHRLVSEALALLEAKQAVVWNAELEARLERT